METNGTPRSEDFLYDASSFADAHDKPSVSVPIVRATPEALVGYGKMVPDYKATDVARTTWPKASGWRPIAAGTGNHQSVSEGDFRMRWSGDVIYGDNMAVGDVAVGFAIGRLSKDQSRDHVLVRDANYHPDGGQIFFPPAGGHPFMMLMAPASLGDDVRPEHFRAFHFDGSAGFHIDSGTWHQPPYFLPSSADEGHHSGCEMIFRNKQSSVFACVMTDTVKEFGVYLRVPLTLQGA